MRRFAALLAVLVATLPAALLTAPTASAATTPAKGWLTVASETPAAGCWIDATVEVRRDDGAVPDVEVAVALVAEGQIVSGDRGVTDGDGFAWLGFDTGWVPAGADAWVDVTMGGAYAGGLPLHVTEDGGCADNAGVAELWGEAPAVAASSGAVNGGSPGTGASLSLWVPALRQQRGLSCEYAAMSIAMSAFGTDVSEYAFDDIVGWSANPHWGYRGDINGVWGGTDDYGVYAEPLAAAAEQFGFWGDVFYAGGDVSALTSRLDQGTPVIVWLGALGDPGYVEYADDGSPYRLAPGEHTVVAYGYDENGVYASDPGSGAYRFYDWGWFMDMWNVFDGMSLAVGPY